MAVHNVGDGVESISLLMREERTTMLKGEALRYRFASLGLN
jgi:hypothetical protein